MFGDLGKMMKMVGRMKAKLPEVQARLEQSEYTGVSGGGAVIATVNGKLALVDLRIDEELLAGEQLDSEILEDFIKDAISAAQENAASAAQAAMKELTGGMELPPGMGGLIP